MPSIKVMVLSLKLTEIMKVFGLKTKKMFAHKVN